MFNSSTIKGLRNLFKEDQISILKFRVRKINRKDLRTQTEDRTEKFVNIFDTAGFPNKKDSSKTAYLAGAVLVLHSGDKNLIAKYLREFKKQKPDTVDPIHLALLMDKRAVLLGKPQIYGTQFRVLKNGRIQFPPIKNKLNLNSRRAKLGLESFENFRKRIISD